MQVDSVVTTVRGAQIRVGDVITQLKIKGIFRSTIYELIEQKVIDQSLQKLGIIVPEDEIAGKAMKLRLSLGIADDLLFRKYLKFYGISADQWSQHNRNLAKLEYLKQCLFSTRKVTESFRGDPLRFASVSVARIVSRTRSDADQVMKVIDLAEKDFVELALLYSADESTRLSGGYIGNVKRGILTPLVEDEAFESVNNQVIGPFSENGLWTIYKIYSVNVPKLTDALKDVIRDQLFREWLREQVCTVPA
jgi:parvulin-like peptidyl-prolyl isomerase